MATDDRLAEFNAGMTSLREGLHGIDAVRPPTRLELIWSEITELEHECADLLRDEHETRPSLTLVKGGA